MRAATEGAGVEITDLSQLEEDSTKHPVLYCEPHAADLLAFEEVQVEHTIDVYLNEALTFRIVCSPTQLVELVLGRLYSEGIIASPDELERLYICQHATRARVYLSGLKADFSRENVEQVPSCCTGNKTLNSYFASDELPAKVTPILWERRWIYSLARAFAQDSPMHRKTSGVHSCYLAQGEEILYCCEDLGRHNAFDKVVGAALLDEVDLRQCIIYTSGRIPVDMVLKALRAQVPILVTKAVPTNVTVQLAREFDLTLICQARPDSMKVYNSPLPSVPDTR